MAGGTASWDKLHKKGCGFFTEMYGIMSDLYLRMDNKGVIIVLDGGLRGTHILSDKDQYMKTSWNNFEEAD